MLGYLIVIAILGFIFTKMTIDILNWGCIGSAEVRTQGVTHPTNGTLPEVIEQPNLSAESGIMDEILSSNEGVRTTYGTQDEYYSGDLGDEN